MRPLMPHLQALTRAVAESSEAFATAERWGRVLAGRLSDGGRLLVAGNGGSAAQAQHLSAEIVGRYVDDRDPMSAIALHADTSSLTAIANDFGVEQIFARQVRAHGRFGDVCLLMSTSGRSANLVAAADVARECGLSVWAMTGAPPSPLSRAADDALCISASTTATVQELHLVAVHVLCAALDASLRDAALASGALR